MNALIEHIEKLGSPVVFSHNDLLYGNIIYNDDKGREEGKEGV
jgi:ethanolamine kinase